MSFPGIYFGFYLPFGLSYGRQPSLSPYASPGYTLWRGTWLAGNMASGWPSSFGLFNPNGVAGWMDNYLRSRGVGPEFDGQKRSDEKDEAPNTPREHSQRGGSYLSTLAGGGEPDERGKVVSKIMGKRPSDSNSPEYAKYNDAKSREENADKAIRALAEVMNSHIRTEGMFAFRQRWNRAKSLDEKLQLILDPSAVNADEVGGLSKFQQLVGGGLSQGKGADDYGKVKGWLEQTLGGELGAVVKDIGDTASKMGASSKALSNSKRKELAEELVSKGYLNEEAMAIFKGVGTEEEAKLISARLPDMQKYTNELLSKTDNKEKKAVHSARAGTFLNAVIPLYEKLHDVDKNFSGDKLPNGVENIKSAAEWLHDHG